MAGVAVEINPEKRDELNRIKRKRRRISVGRFVVFILCTSICTAYGMAYRGVVKLKGDLGSVHKEVRIWEGRNRDLERKVRYLKSDEYVESVARRELGLVKNGEVLIVLSKPGDKAK
jgi:cell division protein FtsB